MPQLPQGGLAPVPDQTALGVAQEPRPAGPGQNLQPEQFVPAGEGLQQVGQAFDSTAMDYARAQDQHDAMRVENATNALISQKVDLTQGPNGFMNLKGANAVNTPFVQTYGDQFNNAATDIGSQLDNTKQRMLFANRAAVYGLAMKEDMVRHLSQQTDAYADTTLQNSITTHTAAAAAQPDNPTATSLHVMAINGAIDAYAQYKGLQQPQTDPQTGITTPSWATQAKAAALSSLYGAQVNALIATNPIAADRLMEQHIAAGDILPKDRLTLEARVQDASLAVGANMQANQWVDTALGNLGSTKTPAQVPPNMRAAATAPSQYDPMFASAATTYGVSAADLKKLAITESSLNPTAHNAQDSNGGSYGLMQINGQHIGSLGLTQDNILDPQTNINAGAQLWAQALQQAGGNKAQAVQLYKGATTPAGQQAIAQQVSFITDDGTAPAADAAAAVAPNTSGLPNARDVRALLPSLVAQIQPWADQHYGTDPSNPLRIRAVAAMTQALSTRLNLESTQLVTIQKQAQGQMLDAVTGVSTGQKITDMQQIQTNPKLLSIWQMTDSAAREGIARVVHNNSVEAAGGGGAKTDPAVFQNLVDRINLPASDPNRIWSSTQTTPYLAHGLNVESKKQIDSLIDDQVSPDGQHLADVRKQFFAGVQGQFDHSTMSNIDGDGKQRFYNFQSYALALEQQTTKAGGDPFALYNPPIPGTAANPNYLGSKIASFQASPQEQIQNVAANLSRDAGTGPTAAGGTAAPAVPLTPVTRTPPRSNFVKGKVYQFKQGAFEFNGLPGIADQDKRNWTSQGQPE